MSPPKRQHLYICDASAMALREPLEGKPNRKMSQLGNHPYGIGSTGEIISGAENTKELVDAFPLRGLCSLE